MTDELEEQILGNLVLKPEFMKRICIDDDYFLDITNRFIFQIFKRQYRDSNTIDILGIAQNYKHLFNERFKCSDIIKKLSSYASECFLFTDFDYYQQLLLSRYVESKILESINKFQKQKISKDELINEIHKLESLTIKTPSNKLNQDEIFEMINSQKK